MGIFRHNIQNDTILCAEFVRANLDKGLETIVVKISEQRFGRISRFFTGVVKSKNIKEKLEQKAKAGIHPYIKKLIIAILHGNKADLDRLSEKALEDKKNEITILTKRVGVMSNWLILLPLVPIGILLGEMIQGSFQDFQMAVGTGGGFPFPDSVKLLILGISAIIAVISVLLIRVRR